MDQDSIMFQVSSVGSVDNKEDMKLFGDTGDTSLSRLVTWSILPLTGLHWIWSGWIQLQFCWKILLETLIMKN